MKQNSINNITTFIGEKSGWFLLFLIAALLFTYNISGWLMHDDEGTDFYEAWQLSEGKEIGVDFIAEQQPLFLLAGKTIIDFFGTNPAPLRLISVFHILISALFFALVLNHIWDDEVALLSAGILLISPMVIEQARLFRPDPNMFAWGLSGLACALLAAHSQKAVHWMLSGTLFGVSILWKPLGIFPIIGLFFFFGYRFLSERGHWRNIFIDGLAFSIPFTLIAAGVSALLYLGTGFYYGEPFSYHLSMGEFTSFSDQLSNISKFFLVFILINGLFLFIIPLWFLNKRPNPSQPKLNTLLLFQLLTPLTFIIISRPLHLRYFLFLIPPLSVLLSQQFSFARKRLQLKPYLLIFFIGLLFLLVQNIAMRLEQPAPWTLITQQESDTLILANYINSQTHEHDVVISDYAGLNFFAQRQSIYEASIIAGAQIEADIVNTSLLINRIETNDVKMVLIHSEGGEPPPHQLIKLNEYDSFIAYLDEHFELVEIFDRAGQTIEIFQRD